MVLGLSLACNGVWCSSLLWALGTWVILLVMDLLDRHIRKGLARVVLREACVLLACIFDPLGLGFN